ncbi:MAG: hypothetical protein EBZ74_11885, partial [Planctomycetia bacterium]|nr:hypothetical protein [Planctomycetia bacterium]
SGGTLRLLGSTTSAAQLTTNGSLALGSNAALVLTNAGTSAGLYRLMSATSVTGSFSGGTVTGVPTHYRLAYTGTEVNLQRFADQATTFALSSGTVTRALVNTSVAVSGSLANTSPAGSAPLAVSLFSAGTLSVTRLASGTGQVSPQAWTTVTGSLNAGATPGTLSWAVMNTDPDAITASGTATGSLNVVAQRTFTTSTATLDVGVAHVGGAFSYGSPTVVVTSTGLNATTANASLGAFSGGPGGFSLTQTGGTGAFTGAAASQSSTFTLSGTGIVATVGAFSGTFTSAVTGEFGGIPNIAVAVTGGVFSGTGTWNVAGGGSWGSGASASWTSAGNVGAAPGTFAGFTTTDAAIFAGTQGGSHTILLNGVSPSLASLAFTNSSGRYMLATGSGGAITLAAASGAPTVNVATGGTHEIAAQLLGSAGFEKTGGGTLVLSGSNALSGIVTVTGGTISLGASQSFDGIAGAGTINLGTTTLTTGSTTSTFAGSIAGNGGLTKAGPGTLTLSGSSTFTSPPARSCWRTQGPCRPTRS